MIPYLIDTNILLLYIRQDSRTQAIDALYDPMAAFGTSVISVVSEGELRSIALQRNWGTSKMLAVETMLKNYLIADIHVREIIDAYAEIDAFSQGKLTTKPLGMTARSMGKNDLWIAATSSVLKIPLLTTDKDFHHLDGVFLDLAFVDLTTI